MAAEVEVERMVARLVGEEQGYVQMLEDADRGLNDLEESTEQQEQHQEQLNETFEEGAEDVQNYAMEVAGAAAAALAAVFAIVSLTDAFGEQEKQEVTLNAIIEANGNAVDGLFERYKKFASQLQQVTTQGDEVTLGMLKQAEALGLTDRAAMRAVKNSIALASSLDMNARSTLRYAALLEEGETTMLQRYMPALRTIEDQSERVRVAQEQLNKMFSIALAEADTLSGQIQQASNAYGDLQERIAELIVLAIRPVVNLLKSLFEWLQNNEVALRTLQIAIPTAAFLALLPAVKLLTVALFGQIRAMAAWVVARIAQLALMGPAGWIILAVAVAGTTASIVAMTQAMRDSGPEGDAYADILEDIERQTTGVGDASEVSKAKLKELESQAQQLKESLKDPFEKAQDEIARYEEMLEAGVISQDEFSTAVAKTTKQLNEFRTESQKIRDDMTEQGRRLEESLRTPFEKAQDDLMHYRELLARGAIEEETFMRAVAKTTEELRGKGDAMRRDRDRSFVSSAVINTQEDIRIRALNEGRTIKSEELTVARDHLKVDKESEKHLRSMKDTLGRGAVGQIQVETVNF